MKEGSMEKKGRWPERIFILVISAIFLLLFTRLFDILTSEFARVDQRLAQGTIVNLNDASPEENMRKMLSAGFYFSDRRDIDLIASKTGREIASSRGNVNNIGELNKNKYHIDADLAFSSGGESFRRRAVSSRALLGFAGEDSSLYEKERTAPVPMSSTNDLQRGSGEIRGVISDQFGNPQDSVLVRLRMLIPRDSLYSSHVPEVYEFIRRQTNNTRIVYAVDSSGEQQIQSLTAFVRTGADGRYAFRGLSPGQAYQVLPLRPGYQFGASKGVESLDDSEELNFRQSRHTIRLLSPRDFNNLKKEGSVVVRTPAEATNMYWMIVAVFFGGFLLIHIIYSLQFSNADQLIIPVLMALTGLSLVTLLSLQDPLRDRFLSYTTMWHLLAGFSALLIVPFTNIRKFNADSRFYRMFVLGNNDWSAKGWQWAGAAVVLLLLTILLGSGPEGSGVKVNLFGLQPSELVKFLLLLFLAAFLAANERFISEYASFNRRWSFFSAALAAILLTIFLFLMLGDLGPAIVVCFTFIILFSFSRGDFATMCAAVILYVLLNALIDNVWIATGITAAAMALYFLFIRKKLSESAVMALVVMSGFMLLDQVPLLGKLLPGPVQRLTDRKAIWKDNWDNEVFGGDQVANGIWAMSGGGITGHGAGRGFAKTIPEAHTDMILPSIGEEFGWTGMVCIFILFLIYLHRSILIGRQTGTPFLFYLASGIGVASFVQFLLIAGGSTGAFPLSGVSLPFISYGGSSLISNFLAAAFLLAASRISGSQVQMNYLTRQHDRNLMPALVAATASIVLLVVNLSRFFIDNEKWVVKPALVADRTGSRMFSYNPRTDILMNRLQAGSIYDRKGRLLATSNTAEIDKQSDSLVSAGLDATALRALKQRRLTRYYPFGEHMFFWTGDANTGVFSGSSNGYFAEYAHAAELRGFRMPLENRQVLATRYREERFLPQTVREMVVTQRDYGELANLLLAGINSPEVRAFRNRNRDIRLSMDGALQTSLQLGIASNDSVKNSRVSIVIMEDSSGDVLASALWPLPPLNDWEKLTVSQRDESNFEGWLTVRDLGFTYATQPGSTAKIVTALSAFNKLGGSAMRRNFVIRQQDLIRTRGFEPDEAGTISLERAFTKSNNPYFILLANEEQLQEEMTNLYLHTGMFLRGVGGYYYDRAHADASQQEAWKETWRETEFRSVRRFDRNNLRATRGLGISGMAWGQGELIATPASMARLVSGISNGGKMITNRFLIQIRDSLLPLRDSVAITSDPAYAEQMSILMKKQSAGRTQQFKMAVAGKTGTPERIHQGQRINDGWYVFYAPKAQGKGHIVACIRIEDTRGSSSAVRLAAELVIPELVKRGYIRGFDSQQPKKRNE